MAASEVGLGRVGLADITSFLDLPPPPIQKSYQRHLNNIAKATERVRYIIQVFVKEKFQNEAIILEYLLLLHEHVTNNLFYFNFIDRLPKTK